MPDYDEIKLFGAGGSFLVLLGMTGVLFSSASPVLLLPSLLAILLGIGGLLVSLYLLSSVYGRRGFVRDFVIALLSPLFGLLIAPSLIVYGVASFFLFPPAFLLFFAALLVLLPLLLGVLPAFLLFRTFGSVREATGESLFRAAAVLSLLSFLSLALVVTAFLFVVFSLSTSILLIVAFLRLRPPQPQGSGTSSPSSLPPREASGAPPQPQA
ncbi:MAG: hypothetical protein ABDH61_00065 [Acidilobaceae archaeon]